MQPSPAALEPTSAVCLSGGFDRLRGYAEYTLWIKELGGNRFIRYNSRVQYMEFEETVSFQRVPWAVRFLHQMQNACTDYGLELEFKP